MKQQPREKVVTAANYVLTLYQTIQTLNGYYTLYCNVLIELQNKYGIDGIENAELTEKEAASKTVQLVRQAANTAFVQMKSISNVTEKVKLDEVIEKNIKIIKETYFIDRSVLEEYVIACNDFLLNDVLQDLLVTSQDIITGAFDIGDNETQS